MGTPAADCSADDGDVGEGVHGAERLFSGPGSRDRRGRNVVDLLMAGAAEACT